MVKYRFNENTKLTKTLILDHTISDKLMNIVFQNKNLERLLEKYSCRTFRLST